MGSWFEIGRCTGGSSRVDNVAILKDLINLEQEVRKLEVAITFVQVFVFRIQLAYIQSMGNTVYFYGLNMNPLSI